MILSSKDKEGPERPKLCCLRLTELYKNHCKRKFLWLLQGNKKCKILKGNNKVDYFYTKMELVIKNLLKVLQSEPLYNDGLKNLLLGIGFENAKLLLVLCYQIISVWVPSLSLLTNKFLSKYLMFRAF